MPAACSAAAIESFAWCTLYLCAWLRFLIHLPPPARSAAMRTQRPQRSVPPLVPMADRESCSSSFSISMQSCRNHSFVFFFAPRTMDVRAARRARLATPSLPDASGSALVPRGASVRGPRRVPPPRARGCAGSRVAARRRLGDSPPCAHIRPPRPSPRRTRTPRRSRAVPRLHRLQRR